MDEQPELTTAQRIADAARDLFVRHGVRATTVDQIAAAAGCSRMTVYRHYPGKRTLLRAVVLGEFMRQSDALEAMWYRAAPLEDRMVDFFVSAVKTARGHALLDRLLRDEPDILLPALTLEGEEMLAVPAAIIAERLRAEPELQVDADMVAELLCRLVLSLVLQPYGRLRLEQRQEMEDFARSWVAPWVRLLGNPPVGVRDVDDAPPAAAAAGNGRPLLT